MKRQPPGFERASQAGTKRRRNSLKSAERGTKWQALPRALGLVLKPIAALRLVEDCDDDGDVALPIVAVEDDKRRAGDDALKDFAVAMIGSHFGIGGQQVKNKCRTRAKVRPAISGPKRPTTPCLLLPLFSLDIFLVAEHGSGEGERGGPPPVRTATAASASKML